MNTLRFSVGVAALTVFAAGAAAQTRERPKITSEAVNPGWIDFVWEHDHRGANGYRVERESPPMSIGYTTDARLHSDKNLTPDTEYRYKVCAIYGEEELCSATKVIRTSKPPVPAAADVNTPPLITGSRFFHEPNRVRITWRKTADYDRVIVRWWNKANPVPSQVDHDGPSDGMHEAATPMDGTYVFILKGCDTVITGTSCGEWSAPYEVQTAPPSVTRVDCIPGSLAAGFPRLSPNARATYLFNGPAPGRTDVAGHCKGPLGEVVATYVTEGGWNPDVKAGAWDKSGANATEEFSFAFGSRFSSDRSPSRPDGDAAGIRFVTRARCDRDPWVHADATCRRTGDNVPADIRAKWPALLTEPFPHARNAIPPADRAAMISRYRLANDRLVGTAQPNAAARQIAPVDRDAIQGQAGATRATTAASRPAPATTGVTTAQVSEATTARGTAPARAADTPLTPARTHPSATLLQRQETTVLTPSSTTTRTTVPSAATPLLPANAASSAAARAAADAALVLYCRGGGLMRFNPYVEQGTGRHMVNLIFQPPTARGSASGEGLKPSECSFATNPDYFPPSVHFASRSDEVQRHLASESNYYTFDVVQGHGGYLATGHRIMRVPGAAEPAAGSRGALLEASDVRPIRLERRPPEPLLQRATTDTDLPAIQRDCTRNGPRIGHLRGRIASQGSFTINGACFGGATGEVQLIGQFAGGTLRPAITRWSEGAIVVSMPSLPDTRRHVLSVSVRRPADDRTSPAVQGEFVPVMRDVEVPASAWTPNGRFTLDDRNVNVNTGNLDNARTGTTKPPRRTTPFRLAINAACQLQTLEVPATAGAVHAVQGWDAGPPHLANVQVVWTPRCVVESLEVPGLARDEWTCTAAFTLNARASCPAGVNP